MANPFQCSDEHASQCTMLSFVKAAEKRKKDRVKARLAAIRQALRDESISYQELAELAALAPFIDPNDTELLEAAGVKEGALMDYLRACEYSDYLLKTGQVFCYLPNGELITREYCNQIIDDYNTIKD